MKTEQRHSFTPRVQLADILFMIYQENRLFTVTSNFWCVDFGFMSGCMDFGFWLSVVSILVKFASYCPLSQEGPVWLTISNQSQLAFLWDVSRWVNPKDCFSFQEKNFILFISIIIIMTLGQFCHDNSREIVMVIAIGMVMVATWLLPIS